jgi:hypothetical protein
MTPEFIRMLDEHREPQIADTLQERQAMLVAIAVLLAGIRWARSDCLTATQQHFNSGNTGRTVLPERLLRADNLP